MNEFIGFALLVAFVAGVIFIAVKPKDKAAPKPKGPVKEPNRPGPKP